MSSQVSTHNARPAPAKISGCGLRGGGHNPGSALAGGGCVALDQRFCSLPPSDAELPIAAAGGSAGAAAAATAAAAFSALHVRFGCGELGGEMWSAVPS